MLNIHGRYEQLELLCNFTSSKFLHLKNTDTNVNFNEKPWWKACGFKKLFSKPNIIFLSVCMFYTSLSKFAEIQYWTVHHNRIHPWPRGPFTRCTYAFGLCKYNSAHWSYLEKIPRHSWLKQIAWQWWSTTKANTNIPQRKPNDGVICLLTKVLVSSQSWPDNIFVSRLRKVLSTWLLANLQRFNLFTVIHQQKMKRCIEMVEIYKTCCLKVQMLFQILVNKFSSHQFLDVKKAKNLDYLQSPFACFGANK